MAAGGRALQVTVHWAVTLLCHKTQFYQGPLRCCFLRTQLHNSSSQESDILIRLRRYCPVMGNVLSPEPGHSGLLCRQHPPTPTPKSSCLGRNFSSDLRSMEGMKDSTRYSTVSYPTPQERFEKCQSLTFGSFINSTKLYQAYQQIY